MPQKSYASKIILSWHACSARKEMDMMMHASAKLFQSLFLRAKYSYALVLLFSGAYVFCMDHLPAN